MILIIDCYDSFSFNLQNYVRMCGWDCYCLRPDEIILYDLDNNPPAGIILSPGPGKPQDYSILHQVIDQFKTRIPMYGICLGFQAIGTYFGAELIRGQVPIHGKERLIRHNGHSMFNNIPRTTSVTRYHSLILSELPKCLECTAKDLEDIPMAIAHKTLLIWGVQFHPEAFLTAAGKQYLLNWLKETIS